MPVKGRTEIILLSSGHAALDHRVFDKEAVTLARHFPCVRVVAAHGVTEMREMVQITALAPIRSRLKRFLFRPLQCYLAAQGGGQRVLILHDAELLFWAPLMKLCASCKIVYDVHEDFAQLLLRRAWIPAPLRRLLSHGVGITEKLFARSCDGVMGATAVLADYFAPLPRVALYNLPSREFIDSAAHTSKPLAEREFDLVHLGTLSSERLDFLCQVFTGVFSRMPAARALVIGVEADQQQRLCERFPAERVVVLGKVGYAQVAGYLGNCRVGIDVHPVLYPHLRCAVPVKVFEYMASGCNVVTSFLPELHRLLGDEGDEHVRTVYTAVPEDYTEEVIRLLDEPTFLRDHQAALLRLVRTEWNWEHEAEKLVQFITTIQREEEKVAREEILDY